MLDLPPEPVRNTPITAEWGRKVVRALRALCPVAGAGMAVDITPNGTTYRLTAPPAPKRSSALELRPWQPKLILEAFSSSSSGGPIYRIAMTTGKIVYQTAEGETTFPEIDHKEADIGKLERSCFQIPNNALTETTLYLVCDRSEEMPRWTFELAAANKPLAEPDAAGVLRFRRKAIAEIDLSKNTLTPLIHGSRLEVADPAAKGVEEAPVAWTVRSRLELPPEGVGDPERVWEVYHPVWICGRATYLPEGMTQGTWNLLDKSLESGTLYAVLQEKAKSLDSDDATPTWAFEKVYLTNKMADIPDEAQPDRYNDGHRCTVVAIGCFSGSGESLKWTQWHVGAIVERTPGTGGSSAALADGLSLLGPIRIFKESDGAVWLKQGHLKWSAASAAFVENFDNPIKILRLDQAITVAKVNAYTPDDPYAGAGGFRSLRNYSVGWPVSDKGSTDVVPDIDGGQDLQELLCFTSVPNAVIDKNQRAVAEQLAYLLDVGGKTDFAALRSVQFTSKLSVTEPSDETAQGALNDHRASITVLAESAPTNDGIEAIFKTEVEEANEVSTYEAAGGANG